MSSRAVFWPSSRYCAIRYIRIIFIWIIGTIMLLVPGVAIANVMRDVLAGDTLTALTKFTEVLIIGLGIAIGIAIPMSLLKLLFAAIG